MGSVLMKVRDGYLDLLDKRWEDGFRKEYVERGCHGIIAGTMRGTGLDNLDFLRNIPELHGLRVLGPVGDASVLAALPGLRSLELPGSYDGPLPIGNLELENLAVRFPHDLSDIAKIVSIGSLYLNDWPKSYPSLASLGRKPELDFLRIEFKRTASVEIAGLQAPELRKLWLYDGRLSDIVRLADFPKLIEVHLYGTKISTLDFVRHLTGLRSLKIENGGELESLGPLRGHPSLVEVAIAGRTTMIDGDLTPLMNLPSAKFITLEKGSSHYTHKPADVRRSEL